MKKSNDRRVKSCSPYTLTKVSRIKHIVKEGRLACKQLEDEQDPEHALEGHVPDSAAALVAALTHVQDVVPPVYPGSPEVNQGERQNDWRGGRIGHGFQIDQENCSDLTSISDAVRRKGFHFL